MRGVLLDGGHSGKNHWSNQLACKDLESHMHKRLIRDVQHFKGRLTSYEVWVGALQWRDWIDRCGEALFHNAYRWAQQAHNSPIPPLYLPYISPISPLYLTAYRWAQQADATAALLTSPYP